LVGGDAALSRPKRVHDISVMTVLKDKLLVIKKYINKHLNKGFIRPSILLAAAPILLAKKLEGSI